MKNKILLSLVGLTLLGCASDFYYENGKKVEVIKIENKEVQQRKANDGAVRYYKTSNGHKLGVKNDILVECNEKIDCKEVLTKYETLSVNVLSDTIFLVTIAKDKNVFEFSQKLYEDIDIKVAHPNFRKEKRRR